LVFEVVAYWTDWRDGHTPPRGLPPPDEGTEEAVKAVMYKESSMIGENLMHLTPNPGVSGLMGAETDWDWNSQPLPPGNPHAGYYGSGSAVKMAYTNVASEVSTALGSALWGVRWLLNCRTAIADPDWDDGKPYYPAPTLRDWTATFKTYGQHAESPHYSDAVSSLFQYGKNIGAKDGSSLTPSTLWPILTNRQPRP
jgi:hypothetical protein